MQAGALGVLTTLGKDITLNRVAHTDNVSQPWITASSASTSYTVRAAVEAYGTGQVDGEVVRVDDRKYLLAASGLAITPAPNDEIVDGSDTFTVVQADTTELAGTAIIHTCQVRRG
jgi:hypothetical protein